MRGNVSSGAAAALAWKNDGYGVEMKEVGSFRLCGKITVRSSRGGGGGAARGHNGYRPSLN